MSAPIRVRGWRVVIHIRSKSGFKLSRLATINNVWMKLQERFVTLHSWRGNGKFNLPHDRLFENLIKSLGYNLQSLARVFWFNQEQISIASLESEFTIQRADFAG